MPRKPKPQTIVDVNASAARILAIFGRALPSEVSEGLAWYGLANTFAHGLSKKYALTETQSAGILAALSPQVSWRENQKLAEDCAAGRNVGALSRNVAKAQRIRKGDPVLSALTSETSPNTGKKVRNFFACISDPANTSAVCVDRHAYDLALGRFDNDETDRQHLGRVGVYEAVASAYVLAANHANVLPCQMQAVTWCAWRNLKRSLQAPLFAGGSSDWITAEGDEVGF